MKFEHILILSIEQKSINPLLHITLYRRDIAIVQCARFQRKKPPIVDNTACGYATYFIGKITKRKPRVMHKY